MDAVHDIGVTDLHEVKFFEHRPNGQSKGFCVVSMGSESSMRLVMERLPKKEINGQSPVVTPPTKQALSNFESQSKTRPPPGGGSGGRGGQYPPGGHHQGGHAIPPGPPHGHHHQGFPPRMGMGSPMRGGPMMGSPHPGMQGPRMQGMGVS